MTFVGSCVSLIFVIVFKLLFNFFLFLFLNSSRLFLFSVATYAWGFLLCFFGFRCYGAYSI